MLEASLDWPYQAIGWDSNLAKGWSSPAALPTVFSSCWQQEKVSLARCQKVHLGPRLMTYYCTLEVGEQCHCTKPIAGCSPDKEAMPSFADNVARLVCPLC